MKLKQLIFSLLILSATSAYANVKQIEDNAAFLAARKEVIKQYLLDLQNADYKDIIKLFTTDGFVISTSRGKVNANTFFTSFLSQIEHANSKLNQVFIGEESHRLAARFHLNLQLKDGEVSDGEYIDEFVFAKNSVKLVAVYMFENAKFQ